MNEKKYICLLSCFIAIGQFFIITKKIKAQSNDSLLNQPVPIQKIVSVHSQPNMMEYIGKLPGQFYGSGDLNHDGIPGENVLGSNLIEADIDGDGIPGTSNDQAKVDSLNQGLIEYFPSDFNLSLPEEKISWQLNTLVPYFGIHNIPENLYGWDCDNYAEQPKIFNGGDSNLDEGISRGKTPDGKVQLKDKNGEGNFPMYIMKTINLNNENHTINAFFSADNTLNFNEWIKIEPRSGERVNVGDPPINPNGYAKIMWNGYFDNPQNEEGPDFGSYTLIEFNLENG